METEDSTTGENRAERMMRKALHTLVESPAKFMDTARFSLAVRSLLAAIFVAETLTASASWIVFWLMLSMYVLYGATQAAGALAIKDKNIDTRGIDTSIVAFLAMLALSAAY